MIALHQKKLVQGVVLIDDDAESRIIIRRFLATILPEAKIFSAHDGIEGLGAVFVDKPELIIVDTTLPKYSGLEVVDFIATNSWIKEQNIPVVMMHETDSIPKTEDGLKNLLLISKQDEEFFAKLRAFLVDQVQTVPTLKANNELFGISLRLGNTADKLKKKYFDSKSLFKAVLFCQWIYTQISLSICMLLLMSITKEPKKLYAPAVRQEYARLRLQTYPTLLVFVLLGLLLLFEVALLFTGGIVIFNKRINSIFAAGNENVVLDFDKSTRDSSKVILKEGVFSLAEQKAPEITAVPTTPEITVTPSISLAGTITPTAAPLTTIPSATSPADAILASDSGAIVFSQEIPYSKLKAIYEESTVNDAATSIGKVNLAQNQTLAEARDAQFKSKKVQVRYQISADNKSWWYINDEKTWVKTDLGSNTANTVQEINAYLQDFAASQGQNRIFIKVFLLSDSTKNIELKKITVARLLDVVSTISEPKKKEVATTSDGQFVVTDSTKLPAPQILNASFSKGDKYVSGRVEFSSTANSSKQRKNILDISDEDLARYQIDIYYTTSTDTTKPASDKTEKIGSVPLQKIMKNGKSQYVFELKTPNHAGGYVTAQLKYTKLSTVPGAPASEIFSELAHAVKNSTFTVTETGDQEDALGGDGVCDYDTITPGSQCTLRAAFTEASELLGNDTIAFNIPTTDPGFVTYATQSTPSSGSAVDGESFWKIQQPYEYATWDPAGVLVDGNTQTVNQGDTNTFGPEVEIDGTTNTGISFRMEGAAKIHNLIINRSGSRLVFLANSDNSEVLRSYIGVDAKGYQALPMSDAGIEVDNAISSVSTPMQIGTSTTDGNIIVARTGIFIISTARASVKGNIIGLDKYENIVGQRGNIGISLVSSQPNQTGYFAEIGGLPSEKNVISGVNNAMTFYTLTGGSTNIDMHIYGNYVGTDSTGLLNRGNTGSAFFINPVNTHFPSGPRLKIGANIAGTNYGNLFRYNRTAIRVASCFMGIDIEYNTIADSTRGGITVAPAPVDTDTCDLSIKNNSIGYSASDPYFGLAVGANQTQNDEAQIQIAGASPSIQGNMIDGTGISASEFGVGIAIKNGNIDTRTNNSDDQIARPVIGGAAFLVLTGSLCGSSPQNCIIAHPNIGIYSLDTFPSNESNLFAHNVLSNNGAGGNREIEVARSGLFELFDGTKRRTNTTDATLTVNLPGSVIVRTGDKISTQVTSLTNYKVNCLSGSDCPASGHTTGEAGKTEILGPTGTTASVLSNLNNWLRITEYIIDGSGTKTEYKTFNLAGTDVSMPTYYFSGDATLNSVNTGSSRSISSQTYHDRGEPWTDKPTANGDISAPNIARFQIAEMEWIDPNHLYPLTLIAPKGTIDDPKPAFSWNASDDPAISTYKVYLDGNLIGTTTKPTVTLAYTGDNLIGKHTWQVKGYRADTSLSGESPVTEFTVVKTTKLELVTPIKEVVINTGIPLLDWNNDATKNVTYFEIHMDGALFKKIDLSDTTSYQILDSETLSESTHEWYVVAYFVGKNSAGININVETGRTTTEKFIVKYNYGLRFTKVVGKNDKTIITNVDLAWQESGNTPPVGSTYKLTFINPRNTEIFNIKNISNSVNAKTVTSELQSRLNTNVQYSVKLELIDNKGKVIASTSEKLLVAYSPQFTGGGVKGQTDAVTPITVGGVVAFTVLEVSLITVSPGSYNAGYLLFAIFDRIRKRIPWGIVYDSVNKRYIGRAIVRMYEMGSNELVATTVTDALGIFKLTPRIGNYYIKVTKQGYTFPSTIVAGQTDNGFLSVYHGESISIKTEKQPLSVNIPIDNKATINTTNAIKANFGSRFMLFIERVNFLLVILGVVLSVIGFVATPSLLNGVIIALYVIFFSVKFYLLRLPKFGKVVDIHGGEVQGIEVGLYETEFDTLLTKTNTNERGEYIFFVPNGKYVLRILDSHYEIVGSKDSSYIATINPQKNSSGIMLIKNQVKVKKLP